MMFSLNVSLPQHLSPLAGTLDNLKIYLMKTLNLSPSLTLPLTQGAGHSTVDHVQQAGEVGNTALAQ